MQPEKKAQRRLGAGRRKVTRSCAGTLRRVKDLLASEIELDPELWRLAGIDQDAADVGFEGQSGHSENWRRCPLMTQSGRIRQIGLFGQSDAMTMSALTELTRSMISFCSRSGTLYR
jgi:hypothetical protein